MKRIFILCISAFVSLVSIGQRVMVVENSDKTTTKILVDKINRVYFEEVEFRFEKEKVSLLEGSQVQLNLINSTGKEASWSSSNTSVASVTNTGLVSAISKGTSTITAKTDDGMECQCEIIVTDITDLISATNIGGAIMSMNGLIKYGSSLNWRFTNNSSETVKLKTMQLIDGSTGQEGNLMSVDVEVAGGTSVAYSTTIGLLGIHEPVTCRFRYEYNGKEYSTDAVYKSQSIW
ncbi:MAG: Ig-like domain-containing protein [Prevotella sp.]|nr:Ig-like domain-containing protein [Prevotella sp.]